MIKCALVAAAVAMLAVSPAVAKQIVYTSQMSGEVETSKTGSKATGVASIVVDTDRKTVDMTIDVTGLKIADLWDKLVAAPVGPIHLHNYQADGVTVLALPAPFGASYTDTAKGFSVTMKGYDYAAGAKTVGSDLDFDGFLKAMNGGQIVLNVHTDTFTNGEISGPVIVKTS